jgi:hypothetical protein
MRQGNVKIKSNQDSWRLSRTVGERVRRIHGAMSAIARIAGADTALVSNILSGTRAATPEVRAAIQKYLDWMGERLQLEALRMEFPPEEWMELKFPVGIATEAQGRAEGEAAEAE